MVLLILFPHGISPFASVGPAWATRWDPPSDRSGLPSGMLPQTIQQSGLPQSFIDFLNPDGVWVRALGGRSELIVSNLFFPRTVSGVPEPGEGVPA